MAKVNTCVAETNTSKRRGQKHFTLGLQVVRVLDRSGEVLDSGSERVEREDVRDGVGSLVCRS